MSRDAGCDRLNGGGWFVVNVAECEWLTHEAFGSVCRFETEHAKFPHLSVNIRVLAPGQPSAFYHAESNQEEFLVLSGECLLLIEEEERPVRTWDLVHCPPETNHILIGAGDRSAVVLMVSNREQGSTIRYPRSELALRHGAGVEAETDTPSEAYAGFPRPHEPGRPASWEELPWARQADFGSMSAGIARPSAEPSNSGSARSVPRRRSASS